MRWEDVAVGLYGEQVLPRLIDVVLANPEFGKIRRRVASGLSGEVVESASAPASTCPSTRPG